jgi:hypothetical protein
VDEYEIKRMRSALENLTDSASNFIYRPVWLASLIIDLREAALVLEDDKLFKKMDDWLSDEEEDGGAI